MALEGTLDVPKQELNWVEEQAVRWQEDAYYADTTQKVDDLGVSMNDGAIQDPG